MQSPDVSVLSNKHHASPSVQWSKVPRVIDIPVNGGVPTNLDYQIRQPRKMLGVIDMGKQTGRDGTWSSKSNTPQALRVEAIKRTSTPPTESPTPDIAPLSESQTSHKNAVQLDMSRSLGRDQPAWFHMEKWMSPGYKSPTGGPGTDPLHPHSKIDYLDRAVKSPDFTKQAGRVSQFASSTPDASRTHHTPPSPHPTTAPTIHAQPSTKLSQSLPTNESVKLEKREKRDKRDPLSLSASSDANIRIASSSPFGTRTSRDNSPWYFEKDRLTTPGPGEYEIKYDVVDKHQEGPLELSKLCSREKRLRRYRRADLTKYVVHNVKDDVVRHRSPAVVFRFSSSHRPVNELLASADTTIQHTNTLIDYINRPPGQTTRSVIREKKKRPESAGGRTELQQMLDKRKNDELKNFFA